MKRKAKELMPQTAIFLVRLFSIARLQVVVFIAMSAGMLAGLLAIHLLRRTESHSGGGIAIALLLVHSGLVALMVTIAVGMLSNWIAKTIGREPTESQRLTISKDGIQLATIGFVPWAWVREFNQYDSEDPPLHDWYLQCVGTRRWNLELDARAIGTNENLRHAVEVHWGTAKAARCADGFPQYVWALPVSPSLWAAYLRFFPWFLAILSVAVLGGLLHQGVEGAVFLSLFAWGTTWCAWKVYGDVWFQWVTGLECPQVFLIRNASIMDQHGRPILALNRCLWKITTQWHEPFGSTREVLTFSQGARTLLELSTTDAADAAWRDLKRALVEQRQYPAR